MIKVRLKTGEIVEVKPNEAHDLIESGLGFLEQESDKQMRPYKQKSNYKTK